MIMIGSQSTKAYNFVYLRGVREPEPPILTLVLATVTVLWKMKMFIYLLLMK